MKSTTILFAPALIFASICSSHALGAWSFTKIAAVGDPFPGGAPFETFSHLGTPALDGDTAIFNGRRQADFETYGFYAGDGGALTIVVDKTTVVPLAPFPNNNVQDFIAGDNLARVQMDEGTAIFFARAGGFDSFFTWNGGTITNASGPNAGANIYERVPVTSGGFVGFVAGINVRTNLAGSLQTVGGNTDIREVAMDDERIYWRNAGANGSIYGVKPGMPLFLVADLNTSLPGNSSLTSFDDLDAGDGDLVFTACGSVDGVYRYRDGVITLIADTTMTLPGSPGPLTEIGPVSTDGGRVVFSGRADDGMGGEINVIYTDIPGQLELVVIEGMPINGMSFNSVGAAENDSISGDPIAIFAQNVGSPMGPQTHIFRADYLPCPGDLNGDGSVGSGDLAQLIGLWGSSNTAADLDGSGTVGSGDLAQLIGVWGPCP